MCYNLEVVACIMYPTNMFHVSCACLQKYSEGMLYIAIHAHVQIPLPGLERTRTCFMYNVSDQMMDGHKIDGWMAHEQEGVE